MHAVIALRLAVLVTVCWGASVHDSGACVCSSSGTPPTRAALTRDVRKSLSTALAVFVGEPIAMNSLAIRFRVEAVWKGKLGAEVVMATGTKALPGGLMQSNSCDPDFPFGQTYLIFGYGTSTETMKAGGRCSFMDTTQADVMSVLDRLVPRRSPSLSVVQRSFVAVVGNVARPGLIEWRDGLTADEAVALAGGPVPPTDPEIAARLIDPRSFVVRILVGVPREAVPAPPAAVLLPDDELSVSRDFVRK